MKKELREFIKAGNELREAWDNDEVENYPDYLPSFDEFLVEFSRVLGGDKKNNKKI